MCCNVVLFKAFVKYLFTGMVDLHVLYYALNKNHNAQKHIILLINLSLIFCQLFRDLN